MNDQILEDLFLDKIDVKDFVNTAFKQQYSKDGDFIVTRRHLLKLCDLTIDKKLTAELLVVISDNLMMSDYFSWDNDSQDGEIVSETVFQWGNPDINYEITELNLKLWRAYLLTGEYKLGDYNNWNDHIQRQKDICKKVNSNWRPVNPKHKIGISGNLDSEPVHGLRHPPEKGTTGWFIWTGEYSTADDFFKPIHAGHLLQRRPDLIKYLGLAPGYRFLIDNKGHEDIWEDNQLLNADNNAR
jgi:hypothetical protein